MFTCLRTPFTQIRILTVTSLVEYQPDHDSIMMYSATAGALYDLKTGAFASAPNPTIMEFRWGETTPAVEIQLKDCTGYQAWPFSLQKAFGQEIKAGRR